MGTVRAGRGTRIGDLKMKNSFSYQNEFDKHAKEQNKWIYDNGWTYKGGFFSSYMLAEFDKVELAKLVDYFVMLREDKKPNKAFILHGIDDKTHEIWSGFINTKDDYQKMMLVVNEFIEEYKKN
jgi:hypothetical protein